MKKIILVTIISIFLASCKDNDTISNESDLVPERNVYIAGHISDGAGNTIACYWKNGERVDLGPGELEDLVVVDGTVYSVGWTYGGSSSYWIGNESFELEGSVV